MILSKMIYQLRFVQADLFQHNCTDQVSLDEYLSGLQLNVVANCDKLDRLN